MKYSVIIIGGGLAGLVAGIELAHRNVDVLIIERKAYPHHKVCGEYISNEVRGYLQKLGLAVQERNLPMINKLRITSPRGSQLEAPLAMGGFGMSRYALDEALYQLAVKAGVHFQLNTQATDVVWQGAHFTIETISANYETEVVIGAYGKRTRLDKQMKRDFMLRESPYVGVKYHIRTDFPKDTIALHNFRNGYCGISGIEEDKYCLCYLSDRAQLRDAGSIPELERTILARNPHLKEIFENSEFLYEKPEVINEISFAPKNCVENHILMAGDSAGLITPLCGNGMAMAIRSGYIIGLEVERYFARHKSRLLLEDNYRKAWQREFALRLKVGRTVQKLFGGENLSELAVRFFSKTPILLDRVVKSTHGTIMAG